MKKGRHILDIGLFIILSLGIALFLDIYLQSARFTILDHSYRPSLTMVLCWASALGLILGLSHFLVRWEASYFGADPKFWRRRIVLSTLPLSIFLLSPWLLRFYTTSGDLRTRLRLLAVLAVLGTLFLHFSWFARFLVKRGSWFDRAISWFSSLSLRRRLLVLFLISFFIYQAAGFILVWEGTSFSGDEPFYLLTAHSLLRDGDINVANNYARQDYFHFYSKKDHPRLKLSIYGRQGKKGEGTIYPINLPGISVLMLPFYWLSQLFSGKWLTFFLKTSLSLWASLLGLQVYLYAREIWERERLSLGLWTLFSFSAPILFYAVHLYPEIPIALFCIYIFRKVSGPKSLSSLQIILCGFLLGLFPWFGLKFSFFFYPLFLVSLYFLFKEKNARFKALAFAVFPVLSMALFYMFVYSLYGTFSPIAVYEGVMSPGRTEAFKQLLLGIPLRARIDTFLDYFLDQRDGLLLYSPLYFFALLGFVEIYRRKKRDFWSLLFIGLPFLLNYAFFTHRQGSSPQGRVLTPLSWILIIAVGYFLVHNRRRIFSFFFGAAAAAGFIVAGYLLVYPSFLYQPTTHEFTSRPGEFFAYLGNLHVFLPPYLPSFIKVDNTRYLPNYFWLAAIAVFFLAYVFSRRERPLGRTVPFLFVSIVLAAGFFLWVLFPRSPRYPVKTIEYSPQGALGFYTFPMGRGVVAKESGDFYLHLEKPYRFLFASRRKLEAVKLRFGSKAGEYDLEMRQFDLPLWKGSAAFEVREIVFRPAAAYKLRNLNLYEIDLRLVHRSDESMLLDPFLFQVLPWRD
ncbi:MAG: hypothetical protein WAU81_05020 [Candidatus Aminicenantales bacterium]